jgi:hypothetical protein
MPGYSTAARDALAAARKADEENDAARDAIRARLATTIDPDEIESLRQEFDKLDFAKFALHQRINGIPANGVKGLQDAALAEEFAEIEFECAKVHEDRAAYAAVIKDAEQRLKDSEASYIAATRDLEKVKRDAPGAYQILTRRSRFITAHPEFAQGA